MIAIYNYITTNLLNNKQYVGTHCTDIVEDGYLGSGIAILEAIKKYGKVNFKREILKECVTLEEALQNEKLYIENFNSISPNGYNISPTGGTALNGNHSEETKQKISLKHKGKSFSKEHKKKLSDKKKGVHQSEESKNKKRVSMFGKNKGKQNGMYGKHPIPWNKGLTKETDERVRKNYERN